MIGYVLDSSNIKRSSEKQLYDDSKRVNVLKDMEFKEVHVALQSLKISLEKTRVG